MYRDTSTNVEDNIYERKRHEDQAIDDTEIPLDMTVRRKGVTKEHDGNNSINISVRPSVITKAPPTPTTVLQMNMENGSLSCENENISSTNCDLFIEEHFRRSLGNTYVSLYGKTNNKNNGNNSNSSLLNNTQTEELGGEVDDHFAKALGNDTWKKIQAKKLNL